MKLSEIMHKFENWAPLELQEDWDNSGLQIGDPNIEVTGIVVSLDCEPPVLEYAVQQGCNLIFNHHPLIFKALPNLDASRPLSQTVISAIRGGIAVYAAHTNLDVVSGGVNDALAEAIGYSLPKVLDDNGEGIGMGRYSDIEPISHMDLIQKIKERMGLEHILFYGDPDALTQSIAVAGGSGSYLIDQAARKGVQTLITGDVKYHEAQYADSLGVSLMDLGHDHSEFPVLQKVKSFLEQITNGEIPVEVYAIPDRRRIL